MQLDPGSLWYELAMLLPFWGLVVLAMLARIPRGRARVVYTLAWPLLLLLAMRCVGPMLRGDDFIADLFYAVGWLVLVIGWLVSVPWALAEWRRHDPKAGEPAVGTAR